MSYPRVSICIPTYNRASMVNLAIDSALNQTYQNIEVVVVDNASTDNIEEVVAQYNDTRLHLVKNTENLGIFGNFNRCIEVSKGEFLHILHSDDYIDPNFTETCIKFFDGHPDVVLTFTSKVIHTSNKNILNFFSDTDLIFSAPEGFRKLLHEGNYINCPSVMTRKSVYDIVGKYSLEYPYAGDFYQWLKITQLFDIAYIHHIMVHYRVGDHNESAQFLAKNPVGYLDIPKIIVQTIHNLGDNYSFYINDINSLLSFYTLSFLISGFQWNDEKQNFNHSFFVGLALTLWALIRPQSFRMVLIKFCYLLIIIGIGPFIFIPPLRTQISKIISKKRKFVGFH